MLKKVQQAKLYLTKYSRSFASGEQSALVRSVAVGGSLAILIVITMQFRSSPVPDFDELEAGPERKQAFFDFLLPIIEEQNREILKIREELISLSKTPENLSLFDRMVVDDLVEFYEVEDFSYDEAGDWEVLIRRVDIIPPSMALAQAANESAWGTSRFVEEGNNFFGHWCFEEGCGLVPNSRPAGASHEVADFDSAEESVERYFYNINHHPAYRELRLRRAALRDQDEPILGLDMIQGLQQYSERGDAYIQDLRSMIRFNELSEYDTGAAIEI